MSYIGSTPASQAFAPGTDTFSGTGSQVAFTLSRNVATVNDILVVVNNVDQQPSAYTVAGSTLTFTAAPSSGTNNIYVRYLSTNLITIAPQQGSVAPSALSTGGPTWDTSGNVTATGNVLAPSFTSASTFGFKNRIINGAMVIDQRNAGASVTPTDGAYTLDRWSVRQTTASKFSVQQNAAAVTPPAGFNYYLGATSLSAFSVGAADIFALRQKIEGYNMADLAWGTASAQTVTLSFWVRSSLTGTFGGSLSNDTNQFYAFTFTISSANTWEQKSITITGPTSGTWLTTTGTGITVQFSLGTGTTYSGTAGSWTSSAFYSATGATSVVGTNGATFYITGVQLEKGVTATSFDVRPYGTELQLCQRYYIQYQILPQSSQRVWTGGYGGSGLVSPPITIPQYMRAVSSYSFLNTTIQYYNASGVWTNATMAIYSLDYQSTSAVPYAFTVYIIGDSSAGVNRLIWNPTGITYAYINSEL